METEQGTTSKTTPEYQRDRRKEFEARGLCGRCGNEEPKPGKKNCQTCLDAIADARRLKRNGTPRPRTRYAKLTREELKRIRKEIASELFLEMSDAMWRRLR